MEVNFKQFLENLTDLNAYPGERPDTQETCLLYFLVSEQRNYVIDQLWQVDVWGKDIEDVNNTAKLIANTFETFRGDLSGVAIQQGNVQNRREAYHNNGGLFQHTIDIRLIHQTRS